MPWGPKRLSGGSGGWGSSYATSFSPPARVLGTEIMVNDDDNALV